MSKVLVVLSVLAAATGTLATRLVWTLLTHPADVAAALGSGSAQAVVSTLLGTH